MIVYFFCGGAVDARENRGYGAVYVVKKDSFVTCFTNTVDIINTICV